MPFWVFRSIKPDRSCNAWCGQLSGPGSALLLRCLGLATPSGPSGRRRELGALGRLQSPERPQKGVAGRAEEGFDSSYQRAGLLPTAFAVPFLILGRSLKASASQARCLQPSDVEVRRFHASKDVGIQLAAADRTRPAYRADCRHAYGNGNFSLPCCSVPRHQTINQAEPLEFCRLDLQ